ncbi:MAG: toxin-antitoxin system HicB family antitoxin [Thermoleophilia bacterium]|nr:toxin-antitoxin system HicB family antitoxin [Thermoleophilia bacterium]
MQVQTFIAALRSDLEAIAAVGDDATAEAGSRLVRALEASAHLRLLDVLGQVALEVSGQLAGGHVEVRVSGTDAELVYVAEEDAGAPVSDDLSARITLRLPEGLKAGIEAAAAREGVSVNAWIVRVLTRMLSGPTPPRPPRVGSRLTGFGRS